LGRQDNYPPWFRAMTSRPFLPKYAGAREMIVWIDADAWVQTWRPLQNLIDAARNGAVSIVEERFGAGFAVPLRTLTGTTVIRYTAESVKANTRRCYERCFGPEIATYGELPTFNTGVFALRSDSPAWATWRDILASGLRGGFHMLVEQLALSIAIRQGKVPVELQPLEANYICGLELPWFDPGPRRFTLPKKKDAALGVVHWTDTKNYQLLPTPNFPDGVVSPRSLYFRDVERVEFPDYEIVGRNDLCPCRSGRRFKHCHGRL